MSPMSGFQFEMDLEESSEEVMITRQQHHHRQVHEYAFGIISSDSRGQSSVVSISEPYQQRCSESFHDDEDEHHNSCLGFQSWSMSSYQSLYQSELQEEDEDGGDIFGEDDPNNNMLMAPSSSPRPLVRSRSAKVRRSTGVSGNKAGAASNSSSPKKIPQPGPLRRRWSTSNIFGGNKSSPQVKLLPEDPDMPSSVSPPETWFSSLSQIPDRIRQRMADRNRFDVSSVPRDQLKQLHCY